MDIGVVLGILVGFPLLALVPAAVLALMYARCRRAVVLVASLAWFVYFPYEMAMKLRILCTGECNIRVDLVLLYPLLALLSVWAVVAYVRFVRAQRSVQSRAIEP